MASIGYAKLPIVNLMVGRGSLFTAAGYSIRMAITKKILERMIRLIFYRKNSYNVFLNDDDISLFIEKKWSRYENSFMIPGPGININSWKPVSEPKKDIPIILFVGRLLRDKGIIELVEASRFLHKKNIFHRLMIVGRVDSCNPNAISLQTIEHWVTDYAVEWLGQRDDVLDVMSNANIIAMPSYLEGFGRVLLEAGLATRAVVTCDTVGCRQAVRHMDNGLLVEPRNIGQIADALEKLILDPKLRDQLAERNYERVKNEFSDEVILPKYSELFKHILSL
jgi:glycosyltransferase involved in cell wall biosynthesis